MKKLFLLFVFTFSFLSFSQTKEIDSLKNLLSKSQLKDSSEVEVYLNLTKSYATVNIDSSEKFSKICLQKAQNNGNYNIVKAYTYRGIILDIKSQSDSARFYYDKALEILDKHDNKIERSVIYTNYSMTYQNSGRMDLALEYNAKAIELEKNNDKELCLLYYNQAILYMNSDLPEIGKKYLKLALNSSEKSNDLRVKGAAIQSLGNAYITEKKLDSARIYLEKGLNICEQTKSPETCFRVNSALGDLYLEMELDSKAYKAILNAKKYAIIRNKLDDILTSLVQLGKLEYNRNNYEQSAKYFKEFETLYKTKFKDKPIIGITAYKSWSETEFKRANYKKSYELLTAHIEFKDSIYTMKNKELLTEAETKYQTEKKDKEIAQQQLDLEKSKTKTQLMSILIISLLLASILLWFLFQQRQKRIQQQLVTIQKEQEVLTLESLIAGEEKERLRIAQELHDGVNGDLSAIKYKLTSLLKMNNNVINEAVTMIDNSCKQVRAISHNLVPPSLKDFNLIEATESYCENMNTSHKPEIHFQYIGETVDLNKKVEVNIFRIIQELVTNAIKHSHAKTIDVQISNRNSTLLITVEDNGTGYKLEKNDTEGIGIKNIKSRVEYLNANLDVVTNSNGTSNTIEIDLSKL